MTNRYRNEGLREHFKSLFGYVNLHINPIRFSLQRDTFNDLNLRCERLPNIQGGEEAGTGRKVLPLKEMNRQWGALRNGFIGGIPLWPIEGDCPLLKCRRHFGTSELP
jgi:hypothetical protein